MLRWEVLLRPSHTLDVVPCMHSDVIVSVSFPPAHQRLYTCGAAVAWGSRPLHGTVSHDVSVRTTREVPPRSMRMLVSDDTLVLIREDLGEVVAVVGAEELLDIRQEDRGVYVQTASVYVPEFFCLAPLDSLVKALYNVASAVPPPTTSAPSSALRADGDASSTERQLWELKEVLAKSFEKIAALQRQLDEKDRLLHSTTSPSSNNKNNDNALLHTISPSPARDSPVPSNNGIVGGVRLTPTDKLAFVLNTRSAMVRMIVEAHESAKLAYSRLGLMDAAVRGRTAALKCVSDSQQRLSSVITNHFLDEERWVHGVATAASSSRSRHVNVTGGAPATPRPTSPSRVRVQQALYILKVSKEDRKVLSKLASSLFT
eukprot:PhM_4_TR6879/c0_g1_i1/m.4762